MMYNFPASKETLTLTTTIFLCYTACCRTGWWLAPRRDVIVTGHGTWHDRRSLQWWETSPSGPSIARISCGSDTFLAKQKIQLLQVGCWHILKITGVSTFCQSILIFQKSCPPSLSSVRFSRWGLHLSHCQLMRAVQRSGNLTDCSVKTRRHEGSSTL